jgi:hypothetical protein
MIMNENLTDDISRMQETYGDGAVPSTAGIAAAAKGRKISDIAVLIIFCVFTISVFAVLIFSVSAYRNIHTATLENHDERIALSFLWTKVKSADLPENVYVRDFHGVSALFIDEEIDGVVNHTAIYHYNGWIYELFFESGNTFFPRDGVRLIENNSLTFEQFDNGLIRVTADSITMYISPTSMNEGGAAE